MKVHFDTRPKPIPGMVCPLCRFPTYDWAEPEQSIMAIIKRDLPSWTAEEGLCWRCYEYYSLRAIEGKKEV